MSNIYITTEQELKDILETPTTKVFKVSSSTCGPCKIVAPTFDLVAEENTNSEVEYVSIEINPNTPSELLTFVKQTLKVQVVPAFRTYKDSEVVKTLNGVLNSTQIRALTE